jgi:hypothetical protein
VKTFLPVFLIAFLVLMLALGVYLTLGGR